MAFIYKTLVEVKLMHEFFLTDKDGKNIFELNNQNQRLDFLAKRFDLETPAINRDLSFQFPEAFKQLYERLHLKIIPSFSGFKIVTQVIRHLLTNGTIVFKPMIAIPSDLSIMVTMNKKNSDFDRYTDSRYFRNTPSNYFFSTEGISTPKTFPYLVGSINPFDPAIQYEQGQLAFFAPNDIRTFYKNLSSDVWLPVKGQAFANDSDALLLPLKFSYTLKPTANETQLKVNLKRNGGTSLTSFSVSDTEGIRRIKMDFSSLKDHLSIDNSLSTENEVYVVEVKGSDGYMDSFNVMFSDTFFSRDSWAVVQLKCKSNSPGFNLVDDEGYITMRKDPSGIWQQAPVFEIPVRSRFLYWRYLNNKGKNLKLTADLNKFLAKDGIALLSLRPRAVTRSWFLFNNATDTDSKLLPNPESLEIKKDEHDRLLLDVFVPESGLFPVLP